MRKSTAQKLNNILYDGKITALYARLSRDDKYQLESNSIINQKLLLTNFAKQNGFKNTEIFIDDGVSGVTFNRPGFKEMYRLIEDEIVSTLIVKDMSRVGREHIGVDQFCEFVLPTHNVRLIAINDGVDTGKCEDEFLAYRSITNEMYSRDLSKKVRSAYKVKDSQGFALGQPPLGYKRSSKNPKLWVIDEKGAEIVRKIFNHRLSGESTTKIARLLKREKVLIPSQYALENGLRVPSVKEPKNKYLWGESTIRKILTDQSYIGNVVNFRTYSKSFKLKRRLQNSRENWKIHKNVHEPIIEKIDFEAVQKTFNITKMRKPKHVEKNMFAGFLKCADCGANLNYKLTPNPENHYFSCQNNRKGNGLCLKTHHIRVDRLMEVAKREIFSVIRFATEFEDEFVKIVIDENYRQVQIRQRRNQKKLESLLKRDKEIDEIISNLFESKALKQLSEERFLKLSEKYENEQLQLKQQIKNYRKIVFEEQKHELNADEFLKIVKKFSDARMITRQVLNALIDKIVVFHREDMFDYNSQRVDFYFNKVGFLKLPSLTCEQKSRLMNTFSRIN